MQSPAKCPLCEKALPGSQGRSTGVNRHPAAIAMRSPRAVKPPNLRAFEKNPPCAAKPAQQKHQRQDHQKSLERVNHLDRNKRQPLAGCERLHSHAGSGLHARVHKMREGPRPEPDHRLL